MVRILIGVFAILHGLMHVWYVILSQRLVAFQPEMGWTGDSPLLTGLLGDATARLVATILYALATLGFVVGGGGWLAQAGWERTWLIVPAAISALAILLFWDGKSEMLVQKGAIGLLIDVAFLVGMLLF
jgi:hypothetical protein